MTDNEIVKALECCISVDGDCRQCPANDFCENDENDFLGLLLDLINRQKAEIENMRKNLKFVHEIMLKSDQKIRTEAIKEFAERLKEQIFIKKDKPLYFEKIDNLVKEMVGDAE